MMWLLRAVVDKWFHRHQWTVINTQNITRGGRTTGSRYTLQCKHCGDVKLRDLE